MAVTTAIAIADPPEIGRANVIHAEGARDFGFDGGIVSGISTYAWACEAVLAELGDDWLDRGWAEMRFRRPVYAGEELVSVVEPDGGGAWSLTQRKGEEITIVGRVGLGIGPWAEDWDLPRVRTPVPPTTEPPPLRPEDLPVDCDQPAMAIPVGAEEAAAWADARGVAATRWRQGDPPPLHPSWLPGRMTPLIRHSYSFRAGVHTTGRIQHLRRLVAGDTYVVAARFIERSQRKGRSHSTSDGVVLDGAGREMAYCRQGVLFLA